MLPVSLSPVPSGWSCGSGHDGDNTSVLHLGAEMIEQVFEVRCWYEKGVRVAFYIVSC